LRPEDYQALALCNRAAIPDADDTAESLQEDDASTSAFERWVAEVDGQVVGHASWFQLPSRLHPHKFWMDGTVHPDYQGRGIGVALYNQVLATIAPKNPISLRTFAREDDAGARRFIREARFC
jgi:mycothiol synthase